MTRRDQADYPAEEDQEEDLANTEEGVSLRHKRHRDRPEDEEDDDDDNGGGFNYKLTIILQLDFRFLTTKVISESFCASLT